MPGFGFDPVTGWNAPTFDDLLADFATYYQAESGITLDTGVESPTLDFARTVSRMFKASYDSDYGAYASGFAGTAEGAALRNLFVPFIGEPLPETFSEVVLPLDGVPATLVTAGSTVTLDSDGVGAQPWVLQGNVVLPGNGTFRYSIAGAKSAAAASTWTITTPVAGWTTAGPNVADAVKGRLAETELEYRQRFSLSLQGSTILREVAAVNGVTSVTVFENPTGIPDAYWGETHWVEMLVQGGTNLDVATAIEATRALGTRTLGNVTQPVVASKYTSGSIDIRFSRPILVQVWVSLTITKGEEYSLDTSTTSIAAREQAIKDQILAWAALRKTGVDATAFQVASQAMLAVPGIASIAATIGLVNPPLDSVVVAEDRQLLEFADARILLFGV